MWSPEGIGADDRAGVFAIVEILKRGLRPTIILTTDEEIGGVGASKLVEDIPEAPCKLNFLIELDRRGSEDCVFYDCDNPFFEDYIEDFGFITNWGSFSDISYIAPKWGMAAVNLSIGYEHEHSKSEILNVSWMFNTIYKVCNILENVHEEDVFEYIPAKNTFQRYDIGYDYDPSFQEWRRNDGKELCWGCLGMSKQDIDSLFSLKGDTLDEAYRVLGVDPNATDDEVRKAYRKLALEHHHRHQGPRRL